MASHFFFPSPQFITLKQKAWNLPLVFHTRTHLWITRNPCKYKRLQAGLGTSSWWLHRKKAHLWALLLNIKGLFIFFKGLIHVFFYKSSLQLTFNNEFSKNVWTLSSANKKKKSGLIHPVLFASISSLKHLLWPLLKISKNIALIYHLKLDI